MCSRTRVIFGELYGGRASGKAQFALFHADKALIANDDMVQHLNIQVPSRLHKLLGGAHIFWQR